MRHSVILLAACFFGCGSSADATPPGVEDATTDTSAADASSVFDSNASDSNASDSTTIDSTASETSTTDSSLADAVGDASSDAGDTGGPDTADFGPPDAPPKTKRWYVVQTVHYGGRTREGADDTNAWKDYGVDLDVRASTTTSANTCTRTAQSRNDSVYVDGTSGIDNNFGKMILPALSSFPNSAHEQQANEQIAQQKGTWMLAVEWNGYDGPAPGALYVAGPRGGDAGVSTSGFVDTAKWPIDPTSIESGTTAKIQFAQGFVSNGIWVSGPLHQPKTIVPWPWLFAAHLSMVPMESLVIRMKLADGTLGTLAGSSKIDDLYATFRVLSPSFGACGSALETAIHDIFRGAADLVAGAPQLQALDRTCDSVSIGFGFEAVQVSAPEGTASLPAAPRPCP